GMSAGGASVHYHYFSPLSKGFSESGTALDPWAMQQNALQKAEQLATFVGCPTEYSRELVACLKSRSGNEITQQISKFSPALGTTIAPFAPVVEKDYDGAFLTKHPYASLLEKTVTDVPWIVAVAEQEGYIFALNFADTFAEFLADFGKIAPHLLHYNSTIAEDEKPYVSSQIEDHYFQNSAGFEDLEQLIGDRLFFIGADTSAKLQAKGNKSPVYFYILGYKGKHGIGEMFGKNSKNIGASHGDGILYYFKTPISDEKLTDSDEKMKAFFLRWIVSFANNQEPKINEVKWQPVTGNE
ncbi:esterase, partial [Oryctes borbonicus]